MNRWFYRLKKMCVLAAGAVLLPHGYELARQEILGWPRQAAQESIISAEYTVKKQGIGGTVVAGQAPGAQAAQVQETAAASAQTEESGVRVIYSSGNAQTKVGPGGTYSPVETVTSPITGYLGGSALNMLANQTASQMLSVLIETNQGKLIMIDGGVEGDAAHLIATLAARGGQVDAWLITHPHSDHIGALNYILNHPECGISVHNIYYSFADISWYQQYEPSRADTVQAFMNTLASLPADLVHGNLYRGQVIQVDNVTITVMNQPYLVSYNSINNSSVAYMLDINGKKALFLGDMGEEAGRQLLADYPGSGLKADIVQMAHHGQYGVTKEVYQAVRPEVCLWACPLWLWNNDNGSGVDSGSWYTLETRSWMAELGVPYHVSIKDGDQVIR